MHVSEKLIKHGNDRLRKIKNITNAIYPRILRTVAQEELTENLNSRSVASFNKKNHALDTSLARRWWLKDSISLRYQHVNDL